MADGVSTAARGILVPTAFAGIAPFHNDDECEDSPEESLCDAR